MTAEQDDVTASERLPRDRSRFATAYGAGPLHLVGLLLSFVVALVAFKQVYDADSQFWWRYALWFVGAAVVHDLVLAPVYLALDTALTRLRSSRPGLSPGAVNYVRFPLVGSGMLLLVFGSAIFAHGEDSFRFASGRELDGYLGRWLMITAVLFAASGLAYAVGRLRSARRA
jgi:hypothetical protein